MDEQSRYHPPTSSSHIQLIKAARIEDLGEGDITSKISIPESMMGCARLVFREAGVLCGMPIIADVLSLYDDRLRLEGPLNDGMNIKAGESAGAITGPLRSLLAAERVVLNFLQGLSGIATTTAAYVTAVEGTGSQILDTRKTTPGWRELEKYAVRCGGGVNHRMGLYDAVLLKDNHLVAIGADNLENGLRLAIERIAQRPVPPAFIEVEVDTLEQLETVLRIDGIDIVLLDNMSLDQMGQAVVLRDKMRSDGNVQLEASGGIRLERVRDIAMTGVERISVGALTHTITPIDIGLDLDV